MFVEVLFEFPFRDPAEAKAPMTQGTLQAGQTSGTPGDQSGLDLSTTYTGPTVHRNHITGGFGRRINDGLATGLVHDEWHTTMIQALNLMNNDEHQSY